MSNIPLDPIAAYEQLCCVWGEKTWDTPFQSMPIFGLKSSLNPLGKQWKQACGLGEYKGKPRVPFISKLSPMAPQVGPPLPQLLNIKWPF
jgi:hypothetical protein